MHGQESTGLRIRKIRESLKLNQREMGKLHIPDESDQHSGVKPTAIPI